MAKKTANDHAADHAAHHEAHEHEGSSVGFYIFIALVLGVITYVEFALVEHQDSWFTALSNFWILVLLIVLSVVKFILVIMFFMHLKGDHRTFTGFFTSGMVIAVGTLLALSALFTVRSLATAQTPQQEGTTEARAGASEGETEARGVEHEEETEANTQAHEGETETGLAHRFKYPAPKTLDVGVIDLSTSTQGERAASSDRVEGSAATEALNPQDTDGAAAQTGEVQRTAAGLPIAVPPPAITLPDPFTQGAAAGENEQSAPQPPAPPAEGSQAASGNADASAAGGGALLVDADTSAGEEVYNSNCASCHQTTGAGVPGAFPPIAGHTPELALAEGGREYLVNLLLYGLQGEIEVEGQAYNGQMPAWAQLSDDELASTLNYALSSWGNAEALPQDYPAFTADELAAQRDAALSAAQVYELRQTLELP